MPLTRRRLLALASSDQAERRTPLALSPSLQADWLFTDLVRAEQLLDVLAHVGDLTVDKVGMDGVRAGWLIAQHANDHRGVSRQMLEAMLALAAAAPSQTFAPGIPFLIDCLQLQRAGWRRGSLQEFGTVQAFRTLDAEGVEVEWSFAVRQPEKLSQRRARFDLGTGPCRHDSGEASNSDRLQLAG